MNDRDRTRGRRQRPDRADQSGRPHREGRQRTDGPTDPALPEDVVASDLDPDTRRDLLSLEKGTAERVARHLVMVAELLYEDADLALEHARAARRRAARVGVVRETAGVAAYNAGQWQEAISELRAARRITGSSALLPLIADAERGLGRPERAIEIARSEEGRALRDDEATEMRIVEAGARLDIGEPEKALVTLQLEDLSPSRTGTAAARLFYAYASALEAAGRLDEATTWFMNASAADTEDATDAEFRLMEISVGSAEPDVDPAHEDQQDSGAAIAETEPASEPEPAPRSESLGSTESQPGSVRQASVAEPESEQGSEIAVAPARETEPVPPPPAPARVVDAYDALLLDLDGTVFAGKSPIPGVPETLERIDVTTIFVTNNASRRPDAVAEHLRSMGFTATPEQVVTSAQSAARLLSEHLEPGSRALVLGTDGLAQEVREVGIAVTRSADDRPLAVIQGFSPETSWESLSEAALAIRAGALWVATNVDATLPSERGLLVGNGSLVAAVANATGQEPLVAGKPAAPLMADAINRSGADTPLVVGDRLDTDIQGAHSVGLDSLLVLSGVSTATDLLAAPPQQRPTFVCADLSGVLDPADSLRIADNDDWRIEQTGDTLTVSPVTEPPATLRLLPSLAARVWALADADEIDLTEITITADDPTTRSALEDLGLGAE
ncbi:HAD-superfamily hydrolase, subfamily IIA [Gordonia polyisoprenivorans VH2]|uniref:HAD-superfamily hydrolase, subfamily IIA n=1 Tax=Gordonia polyisoprenivorans (strain DSM 44266 / VH2) TaxID=1112204 RepID=H6N4P1_GORPV|nr:HAD-IIA family hydrolase [Gordonia polyisoprenivorans]AFA73623.1 HAD-superfamily hydrolase, subfamily IIA [Gordonia polyisoprenivorans VH2]